MNKSFRNQFTNLPEFGRSIIDYLVENNENLWKLLKYDSPDALQLSNLTTAEKVDLIYNGEGIQTDYKVFRQDFTADAFSSENSQLRIFLGEVEPINAYTANVDFCFYVISHSKNNTLDGMLNRAEYMLYELMESLNGISVEGVGVLFLNSGERSTTGVEPVRNDGKGFSGYKMIMSTKCG